MRIPKRRPSRRPDINLTCKLRTRRIRVCVWIEKRQSTTGRVNLNFRRRFWGSYELFLQSYHVIFLIFFFNTTCRFHFTIGSVPTASAIWGCCANSVVEIRGQSQSTGLIFLKAASRAAFLRDVNNKFLHVGARLQNRPRFCSSIMRTTRNVWYEGMRWLLVRGQSLLLFVGIR